MYKAELYQPRSSPARRCGASPTGSPSPVLHSPSEYGLEYEDVSFPARDGVPLDGWFIPAPGSGKLVIANHPMGLAGPVCPPTFSPGRRTGSRAAMDSQLT
jgi:hypothetical protein